MIYFMQAYEGGPIKIGTTGFLAKRLKELEASLGYRPVVLATMAGGYVEEAATHQRFAAYRVGKTEFFRPDHVILDFIATLPPYRESSKVKVSFLLTSEAASALSRSAFDRRCWPNQVLEDLIVSRLASA